MISLPTRELSRSALRPGLTLAALLAASLAASPTLADSTARLLGPAGKCIGVTGDSASRATVALESCDPTAADQLWRLPAQGFSGPIVADGGLCLDVDGASTAEGARIQLFECHGGENQQWRYDGSGLVGSRGRCVSIRNGGVLDGTPAVLDGCHGGDNQRFLAETRDAWSRITGDTGRRNIGDRNTWVTTDPAVLYNSFTTNYDRSFIERSEDGGYSWTVLTALPVASVFLLDDVDDAQTFFFVDGDGEFLLRSDDGGRSYRGVLAVHDAPVALAQDPTDHEVFAALVGQVLWRSTDGGRHFVRIGETPATSGDRRVLYGADGDLYVESKLDCRSSSCDPARGIFRASDDGASWQELSFPFGRDFATLYPHPTQGDVLYLKNQLPSGSGALLRSDDAGATWTLLEESPAIFYYTTFEAPDSLWTVVAGKLHRSDDRGATWTDTVLPFPSGFGLAARKINYGPGLRIRVWAQDGEGQIYRLESLDGGATWDGDLESPRPPQFDDLVQAARPGRFYATWQEELWRSDDGARTWQAVSSFPAPNTISRLVPDPVFGDRLFWREAGTRILRSDDGGVSYTELSSPSGGGGHFQALAFGNQTVLLEVQPNIEILWRSVDGGHTWTAVTPPFITSGLAIDGQVAYAWSATQIARSTDGGASWQQLDHSAQAYAGIDVGGGRVAYIEPDAGRLHVSADRGETWAIRPLPPSITTYHLSVDSRGYLYVQDTGLQLLRSRDDGRTWELFNRDLPRVALHRVLADRFDPARLFATGPAGLWSGRFHGQNLLLGNGRFEAKLTWRDPQGGTGVGSPIQGTNDTGFFWFFSSNRTEVAVKLLDGRAFNGRYWVFVASLSNVEFDLEIKDLAEGNSHTYHNPQGVLASFGDTGTFPIEGPEPGGATYRPAIPSPLPAQDEVALLGRFDISVAWRDAGGQTGVGLGGALNEESAGFYFFDADNLELVVNVIDGRAINGHYWVFFAGLSNVEYTITVRDRDTGAVKTYTNPLGTFASRADANAF